MLETQGSPWQASNWRNANGLNTLSRPMLACEDGSFLPLVAKYSQSSNAPVFEVDTTLCPDIRFTVRKASPQPYRSSLALRDRPHSAKRVETPAKRFMAPDAYIKALQQPSSASLDYQHRIDSIVADTRYRSRSESRLDSGPRESGQPMNFLAAITAASPKNAVRFNYSPTPSGNDPDPDKKIYCTFWIRTGECDYVQQGCRYKHEMPDMETLKKIGFQTMPRWYREKLQYGRPALRPRRDVPTLHEMLRGHLGSDKASSESSNNDSDSESGKAVLNIPRRRVVIGQETIQLGTNSVTSQTPRTQEMKNKQEPVFVTPPEYKHQLVDLLSDEQEDYQQPPKVPNNSPQLQAFRPGRFVPSNEQLKPLSQHVGANLHSLSPMLLEPQTAVASSQVLTTKAPQPPNHIIGYEGMSQQIQELQAQICALQKAEPTLAPKGGLSKSEHATASDVTKFAIATTSKHAREASKNDRLQQHSKQGPRVRLPQAREVLRGLEDSKLNKAKVMETKAKEEVPKGGEKKKDANAGYKYLFKGSTA